MIRRLISVSLLLAVLLSMTPVAPATSGTSNRGVYAERINERSGVVGLESYALLGSWLLHRLLARTEHERSTSEAPPVTAYLNPAPLVVDPPTNLTVTAASDSVVSLSWTAPAGFVDHYQVERSASVSGSFAFLANAAGTTFNDSTVSLDHAYLYRVRAVGSGSVVSLPSNMAFGTATSFEFNQLLGKEIKGQHFYDVRTAINAVRTLANLTPATWSRSNLNGLTVETNDVQELRTKLGEALAVLGISVSAYEDATLNGDTLIRAIHLEQLQTRSTRGSSTAGPLESDSSTSRLDPLNQTGGGGENPLSRNFNWTLPLVSLPGRAGMDLSLSLSYNSLVWTKSGNYIWFDSDHGFPGPGFRIGFPVIQPQYFNADVGKKAFLLIGTDGSRTELRQVGTSMLYEAADSSHLLLDASTMTLRTTDGTQLSYAALGTEYGCTEIKDRNGNYITITYTAFDRIDTVIDTLGRNIKFNYDASGWLTSITQVWNQGTPSQVTHNWATFAYTNTTIDTNFSISAYGPADGSSIKTLAKVTLADDSHYDFSYTTWGQVWKVSSFAADNHVLNYRSYNLPQTAGTVYDDCPRFTERHDWAENWNQNVSGIEQEAVTVYAVPISAGWTMPDDSAKTGTRAEVTTADGTVNKIYFIGTNWRRGLPALVETYSGGNWQRKVMTTWTQDQDNESILYQINPRVTETNIYDPAGNRSRVQTTYQQATFANGTSCWLPRDVYEYAANATTILRSTRTDYHTSTVYTDRRIIGLVTEKKLYEGDVNNGGVLKTKVGFFYDNENSASSIQNNDTPVQHDNTNYSASFVTGRANLSSVRRYNVTNTQQFTTTSSQYNTAGAVVSSTDAAGHVVQISYSDSFSDGVARTTRAYPTKVTDPDGYYSTAKYNYDFGALTYKQTPPASFSGSPASQPSGPEQTYAYDSIGRLQQVTNEVNDSYIRYVYPTSLIRVDTYATIQEGLGEAHSFSFMDGAGRVIGTSTEHPGSTGGYSGRRFVHDVMGRVIKTSNPTETSAVGEPSDWAAAGDDVSWIYTQQTYDWKGRPLVITNQDGTTRTASYSGCGCAGGEVVTLTDEGTLDGGVAKRRQQKLYSDVLGRQVKTEILNWSSGSIYSATVNTYNARDQIELITQYAGAEGSATHQETTIGYDGYGRLQSRHVPEQDASTATVWTYNADDTVNTITDARGAVTTYGYTGTNRHLVKQITHTLTGKPTISSSFTYDAVGNRLTMTDGAGSVDYSYNQLSELTSEMRTITGIGSFTLNYAYNLSGQLSSVTDPFGAQVGYSHDKVGRLSAITGSNFASVSSYASGIQYRAWGALKALTYGNSKTLALGYDVNLKVSSFEIPGIMKKSYQYYDDGRLKFTQDQLITNSKFDRLYTYDHLGRIASALSGAEARGGGPTNDRPYQETLAYDAMGHLTLREVRNWDRFDTTGNETYINNRHQFWQYDADGRVLAGISAYTYDSAGRISMFGDVGYETDQQLDGDGRRIKSVQRRYDVETDQWVTEKTTYYIHSSVIGEVISELSAQGAKDRSFVFAGSNVLAVQSVGVSPAQSVFWKHYDPSSASYRSTDLSGSSVEAAEMDPMGADAGLMKPFTWPQPKSPGKIEPYYGIPDLNSAYGGCVLDGIPSPCTVITEGNSKRCDYQCRTYSYKQGRVIDYHAYSDEREGYLPLGWSWTGSAFNANGTFLTFVDGIPQNSERQIVPLGNLQKGLEDLLRGDCGAFVQRLIDKANSLFGRGRPHATSFWDAFSRIQDAGGFQLDDVAENGGTVSGELFVGELVNPSLAEAYTFGPGTVHLQAFGPIGRAARPAEVTLAQARYVYKALHETLHLAKRDHYSDEQLARAGHEVDGTTAPEYGRDDYLSWSGNFDTVLQRHCAYPFK